MSPYVEEKILARLEPVKEIPVKTIQTSLSASSMDTIKRLAKNLSKVTGHRVTQTMLLQDAVDALIEECMADPELKPFFDEGSNEIQEPEEALSQGYAMSL